MIRAVYNRRQGKFCVLALRCGREDGRGADQAKESESLPAEFLTQGLIERLVRKAEKVE